MIRVDRLTKRYGDFTAVSDLIGITADFLKHRTPQDLITDVRVPSVTADKCRAS